jgi:adenylate cyclase
VIVAWAVLSLLEVPPMDQVFDTGRTQVLRALTPIGIVAYAFAAWRYVRIYRVRRRPLPLAVAASFVLLAEALVAVALRRRGPARRRHRRAAP